MVHSLSTNGSIRHLLQSLLVAILMGLAVLYWIRERTSELDKLLQAPTPARTTEEELEELSNVLKNDLETFGKHTEKSLRYLPIPSAEK